MKKKDAQAILYEQNTGKIEIIEKIKVCNLLKSFNLKESMTYKEIAEKCNFKLVDKGIYNLQTSNPLKLIFLIDRTVDEFKRFLKKHNMPIENDNSESLVLYHGSRKGISGKIQPISRINCDFGKGFYLGQKRWQTEHLVCNESRPKGYKMTFSMDGLKIKRFGLDKDWVLFIAKNREMQNLLDNKKALDYVNKNLKGYDLYIGTIADDIFANVLNRFFINAITLETLIQCLDMYDYGLQYCFATQKACDTIKILDQWDIPENKLLEYQTNKERQKNQKQKLVDKIINDNVGKPGTYFSNILKGL